MRLRESQLEAFDRTVERDLVARIAAKLRDDPTMALGTTGDKWLLTTVAEGVRSATDLSITDEGSIFRFIRLLLRIRGTRLQSQLVQSVIVRVLSSPNRSVPEGLAFLENQLDR
jgi:hypothetical protein